MEIIIFFILNVSIFYISKFFLKENVLLNQSGEQHQRFVEKLSIPLIIGFLFLIIYLCFPSVEKLVFNFNFYTWLISDLKLINSPKKDFFYKL